MDQQAFSNDLATLFEIDEAMMSEAFELSGSNWDSMAIVGTIALIDEHFGVTVDAVALADCKSVGELLNLINAKTQQ